MTPATRPMTAEELTALRNLLAYNWHDEQRDYEEYTHDQEGHIFVDMKKLDRYLEDVGFSGAIELPIIQISMDDVHEIPF